MAYLPPTVVEQTGFPKAQSSDFWLGVRMAEENWIRHFPLLDYWQLNQSVEADIAGDHIVGPVGTTNFDAIYGESVDAAMAAGWQQPHNDDTVKAVTADIEIFKPVVQLPMLAKREVKDKELKRWGFDEVRDLIVTVPLSLLDSNAVIVRPGDKIEWDGDAFNVLQSSRDGYWANTNIRLYMVINLAHRREGS